jgi:Type III restriction enzyme, res subunit
VGEIGRAAYYPARSGFRLYEAPERPAWRPPQLGAIGALMAHWSLPRATAALVSLPTGTGKTAVGVAAPHILHANRALVVVPSMELRRQMSLSFRDEGVLRRIGALPDDEVRPVTVELTGRVGDWAGLQRADVVVAIPMKRPTGGSSKRRPSSPASRLISLEPDKDQDKPEVGSQEPPR